MPKLKTHKGTIKRIKITGSGKILAGHAASRHLLTNKSTRNKNPLVVSAKDVNKIKKMVSGIK
jgi:large subunit ribosomal protein L35